MAITKSMKGAGNWLPAVDLYIAKAGPFPQPILSYLRELVHEAVPDVVEEMKWSRPFFVHRGVILGNISGFKQHCAFGLWGTEVAAVLQADGVESKDAMGTFGRITSVDDLPSRKKMIGYIKNAAAMIEEGVRTKSIAPRPKVAKPPTEIPSALSDALKMNKIAAQKFAAMSSSCQREYAEWIAYAKRDETRDKRLATALEWIAQGKSRNWKYETRA